MTALAIARERSDTTDGAALLAAYFDELRRVIGFDPARSVPADPDAMAPPHGAFFVAREGERPVACGGLKTLAPGVGEIKRMYVVPDARGRGVGRALLARIEAEARALGMTRLVLDTGGPLTAAARLYTAAGYRTIPPYNDNPFATAWFEKVFAKSFDKDV